MIDGMPSAVSISWRSGHSFVYIQKIHDVHVNCAIFYIEENEFSEPGRAGVREIEKCLLNESGLFVAII